MINSNKSLYKSNFNTKKPKTGLEIGHILVRLDVEM